MVHNNYLNTRFSFNRKRDALWQVLCQYLQKFVLSNARVLDIGAGYCNFINHISAEEKHALDISEEISRYAHDDVVVHIQSCTNMDNFGANYFHIVFASNIFEHLSSEEFEKTIEEVRRILVPSGRLIIIQPNFKYGYDVYFDDFTHKQIYTHIGLCDLLKTKGFTIEKVIPKFLPFSIKSKLPMNTYLLKLYLKLPIKPFAKQMLIVAAKSGD